MEYAFLLRKAVWCLSVMNCRWTLMNAFILAQVYIIGGDGTQKGAAVIYEVILFIKI